MKIVDIILFSLLLRKLFIARPPLNPGIGDITLVYDVTLLMSDQLFAPIYVLLYPYRVSDILLTFGVRSNTPQ